MVTEEAWVEDMEEDMADILHSRREDTEVWVLTVAWEEDILTKLGVPNHSKTDSEHNPMLIEP